MRAGMAKSPQKVAARKKAASGPDASLKCESLRKVADSLGGGEARLYNIRKHPLPDLAQPPKEKDMAACDWWLVHFPSRRCLSVPAGRLEGMRLLKKLSEGKDEMGWLPTPKPRKVKKAPKKGDGDQAGAGAGAGAREEGEPEITLTTVPAELGFDAAMKFAFPNQRIVHEIEKMIQANDEVVIKGVVVGSKPNWTARKEGLRMMIEHAQGRAGEKPPPPPEKKRVSYAELEEMLLTSPATRKAFKSLIEKAEKMTQDAAVPPPAPPEGKA